jgi:hypothetical protein
MFLKVFIFQLYNIFIEIILLNLHLKYDMFLQSISQTL